MTGYITKQIQMVPLECSKCGAPYCITEEFQRNRRSDGATFWCPSGHGQVYSQSASVVDKLNQEIEAKNRQLTQAKCDLLAKQHQIDSITKEHKRHLKRIKNGVCPCCQRSFINLKRHLDTKHPDYQKAK